MKAYQRAVIWATTLLLTAMPVLAQDSNGTTQILFQNVRVFDGTSDSLTEPTNVLVNNNLIDSE